MATEDSILLKLVIQGMNPEEVNQLANSTQGQLNAKIKALIDQLTQAHRDAQAAQTSDAVANAKKRQDVLEKQIEVVAKVQRANEIAANRSTNAWKGTLEVMENFSVAAQFSYNVISSGLGRLKELGDSIDKITNVYGSLKGSIDEMREAARGEVSDFDLIATKNRALEKDLELTDKQFGLVASAADNFADSIGTNTKEALDKLIDGLVQGRIRTLQQAGVMVDQTKAFDNYAKSIGVASDQLSEHGKKVAIIQAALDKLAEKSKKAGEGADDFSHRWEKMTAAINNATDSLKRFLGEIAVDAWDGIKAIPTMLALEFARVKDVITFGTQGYEKAILDALGHENDKTNALTKIAGQKFRRYGEDIDPNSFLHPGGTYAGAGDRAESINAAKVAEDAKKAQAAADEIRKTIDSFDKMFRKGSELGEYAKRVDEDTRRMTRSDLARTDYEKEFGNTYDPNASRNALSGRNNSTARTQAMQAALSRQQENIALSMEAPNESNDLSRGRDSKGAVDRMEKAMKDAQDRLDDLRKRSGDGILSAALFGTDGPGGMTEKLRTFSQDAADALGMVTEAGQRMGEALGEALAAFVSGDKSKRASLRQTTFAILESLSMQAYARAIFETAEGLASLALGPIGGASAGMHFAAAGMFTAVGTAAGLGARAVGQGSAATSSSQASGSPSEQSRGISSMGNGFGSSGMRSSSSGNGGGNVTISITSTFGDKVSIGRAVNDAMAEYYAQTGRGVPAAPVSA